MQYLKGGVGGVVKEEGRGRRRRNRKVLVSHCHACPYFSWQLHWFPATIYVFLLGDHSVSQEQSCGCITCMLNHTCIVLILNIISRRTGGMFFWNM